MKRLALVVGLLWLAGARAESLRDCAECPEMAVLPAGSYVMGDASRPGTAPARQVSLRAFALGRFEVTQGEWRAVMGSSPSAAADCGDACPVERVSWQDAQDFVQRLSARTGKRYRLPCEAEWEYACRAGERHDWCGGDDPIAVAWAGDEYGGPQPVGRKRPNAWGLHDMSGNVWEWTQDCNHPNYQGAPADGSARDAPGCKSRVLRGGSWQSGIQYGRTVLRFGFRADFRAGDFGFRVARDLE